MRKEDLRYTRTEDAIRQAFTDCVNTVGYTKTTVAMICRRAKINRKTFYGHYLDKEDLLVISGNGEVIATGESYSSEATCLAGVESVRKNAVAAKLEDQTVAGFETVTNPKFEVYTDKAGEYRFRLKARNGEIIAVGEGYKAKASCLNGIESIRKNAPEAEVVKE